MDARVIIAEKKIRGRILGSEIFVSLANQGFATGFIGGVLSGGALLFASKVSAVAITALGAVAGLIFLPVSIGIAGGIAYQK